MVIPKTEGIDGAAPTSGNDALLSVLIQGVYRLYTATYAIALSEPNFRSLSPVGFGYQSASRTGTGRRSSQSDK